MVLDEGELRRFEADVFKPQALTRVAVVVLLSERPGHGYDLMARLRPLCEELSQPGRVYRALRHLEAGGLVCPHWDTDGAQGPARRVYQLSAAGCEVLEAVAPLLRRRVATLGPALARYVRERLHGMAGTDFFAFTGVIHLAVGAVDEPGARRKLARALVTPRSLVDDVQVTAILAGSLRLRRAGAGPVGSGG